MHIYKKVLPAAVALALAACGGGSGPDAAGGDGDENGGDQEFSIGFALKATMGWRIDEDAEVSGIDAAEHAESAYDLVARGGRLGVTSAGIQHDARHHEELATDTQEARA